MTQSTLANAVQPLAAQHVTRPRAVEQLVAGHETSDGAGVRLTRVLTQPLQRRLDPFLMLDAFGSDRPDDYIGGFPDHPHRGFETVTYMISWLNLRAQDKMGAPWYRDIQSENIPGFTTPEGVHARVIAGASHGVAGAVQRDVTQPLYLDLHFDAEASFAQSIPAAHNAFVYVYRGELQIGATRVPTKRMAIFANATDADGVILRADAPARAILIAGQPLGEPIAQHGPFVMNTHEQLIQAVQDYHSGRLGKA